jgi:fatty acid desaturase
MRRFERWTAKRYRASKTLIPAVEILFAVYFAVAIAFAALGGHWVSVPFLALFLVGFAYVGVLSLHQSR